MIFDFEERASDSPFIERVWRTRAERGGHFVSIAASNWEMVVTRYHGERTLTVRGPETAPTPMTCHVVGAEFVGIIFKLGAFMPQLPPRVVMNRSDANLPPVSASSFWLHGSAWHYPNYENADTFVGRLVREGLLVCEPGVEAALRGRLDTASRRTTERHFLRATGLPYRAIRQIERARHATMLLRDGASIPDTIFEAGYFDQPHLTRSLLRFIGQTPAQIMDRRRSVQLSLLYKTAFPLSGYSTHATGEQPREGTIEEAQARHVRRARRSGGEPGLDRAVLER